MLVDAQQDAEEEAAGGMSRSGGGGVSPSGAGAVQQLAVKAAEEAGALLSDTEVLSSRQYKSTSFTSTKVLAFTSAAEKAGALLSDKEVLSSRVT